MYVAIGIGTLLLSGWVLRTGPAEEKPETPAAQDESVSPYPPGYGSTTQGMLGPQSGQQMRGRDRTMMPERQRSDTSTTSAQQKMQSRPQGQGMMPMAPTESLEPGAQGALGMIQPPTKPPDEIARPAMGPAEQAYGSGGRSVPSSPTSYHGRPSGQFGGGGGGGGSAANSYGALQQQVDRQLPSTQAPVDKAFSGYRQPSYSGNSPYMNLFRTDTNRGTIDNYSTLVRPALDQQNMNQQFHSDIFGLERNARIQNSQLQQLQRGNSRSLQGIGTPQYYGSPGQGSQLPQVPGQGYNPYNPGQ